MYGKDAHAGKSPLLTQHKRKSPIRRLPVWQPHHPTSPSVPGVEQNEEKAPNWRRGDKHNPSSCSMGLHRLNSTG